MILVLSALTLPISDGDTFFHLAVGKNIVENGFFTKDPFSIHNLYYSPQQWLSDVIFYKIFSLGGYAALFIFQYIYLVLFMLILFFVNKRLNRNPKQNLLLSLLGSLMLASMFLKIRPQIFTFILFVLEVYFLEAFMTTNKIKYLIYVIISTVICVNVHVGYFPFMVIILCPYIVDSAGAGYKKPIKNYKQAVKLASLIPGIILVGGINPYGYKKLLYFKTLSDKYITAFISEWQAPGISYNGILIFIVIFSSVFLLYRSRKKLTLRCLLLLSGLCFMSLISVRYFIYFELALCIYLNLFVSLDFNNIPGLDRVFYKFNKYTVIYFSAAILIIGFKSYTGNFQVTDFSFYPVQAVSYIKDHDPQKRLFNEYNDGSYLLFNNIPVFVDSRADLYSKTLNNTHVLEDYFKLSFGKLNYTELLSKYKIERILTTKDSIISTYITKDITFSEVYKDKNYIIYDKIGG